MNEYILTVDLWVLILGGRPHQGCQDCLQAAGSGPRWIHYEGRVHSSAGNSPTQERL